MITIENNFIDRDGKTIGQIVGNKAYLFKRQAGVIIGQIKKAAGIELDFDVVDELPNVNDSLTVDPISAAGFVSFPSASEAESVRDVAGSATTFDTSGFDCTYEEDSKLFAQCFINTYGPHGYSEWLKLNGK